MGLRDKRVTPMPEQTLLLGVSLNTNHLQEHPNNLAVTPAATPAVLPTSPSSSRRSPTACSPSPPHALAHRASRPPPLLRHLLPPPCLRPLPPPALPAQAPCSRPASW